MNMIRNTWGARLRQVFLEIPDPTWRDAKVAPGAPLLETDPTFPVRAPMPATLAAGLRPATAPVQLVASTPPGRTESQQGG
jgi:putative proteasome-type protease